MKQLTFILLVLSFLYSCEEGPRNLDEFLVDTSEFQMDTSALKNGQYVEILGSSGNLTREHEIDFYTLVVVRSEETGDTVNILLTSFYQSDLNDPRTQFISNSSDVGKLLENYSDSEKIDGIKLDDIQSKTFDKVLYDTEFIQMDVRKFPTVTGHLGWSMEVGENADI